MMLLELLYCIYKELEAGRRVRERLQLKSNASSLGGAMRHSRKKKKIYGLQRANSHIRSHIAFNCFYLISLSN